MLEPRAALSFVLALGQDGQKLGGTVTVHREQAEDWPLFPMSLVKQPRAGTVQKLPWDILLAHVWPRLTLASYKAMAATCQMLHNEPWVYHNWRATAPWHKALLARYVGGEKIREWVVNHMGFVTYDTWHLHNQIHGTARRSYDDGSPEREAHYVHGQKHGPETYWFRNGKELLTGGWYHGTRHGTHTYWHIVLCAPDQKKNEEHYVYGQKHGTDTEWYEDGQMKTRAHYVHGENVRQTWWDRDGNITRSQ